MKPLSVEMAFLLGIQNEIQAVWITRIMPHFRDKNSPITNPIIKIEITNA